MYPAEANAEGMERLSLDIAEQPATEQDDSTSDRDGAGPTRCRHGGGGGGAQRQGLSMVRKGIHPLREGGGADRRGRGVSTEKGRLSEERGNDNYVLRLRQNVKVEAKEMRRSGLVRAPKQQSCRRSRTQGCQAAS